jgi:hypothetical protein
MAKSFKQFLIEAPVGDYQTIGNFEKGSSFRNKNDRTMLTSEKAIRNVRKKFGKTPYNFNLYFVNSAKANRHTEVGQVDMSWIEKNLDPQVAEALKKSPAADESINIVYTNNKGDEKIPLTPWMMAHRFSHAAMRGKSSDSTWSHIGEAQRHLVSQIKQLMEYYGRQNFDPRMGGYDADNRKRSQQAMLYMFYQMASFKSARDRNLREWREIIHELLAEYIITGKVTFKPLPQCFGGGAFGNKQNLCAKKEDMDEIHEMEETLARDMQMMLDDVLGSSIGNIYVM